MKQHQIEKWSKTRKKGEAHFILYSGVLGWGIPTAILWSIWMEFIEPSSNILVRPIIALFLFPVGGYFYGKYLWKGTEKKYLKATNAT